jgi:NitT/TauT family transport system substrate-binding protein
MTDAILTQARDKMKSYALVTGGDAKAFGTGGMTDKRWREFYQTMQSVGIYPKGLDVTKAYDLKFMRQSLQNYR